MPHMTPQPCEGGCCDDDCELPQVACPRRKDTELGYVLDWTVSDNATTAWVMRTCYSGYATTVTRIDLDLGASRTGTMVTDLSCDHKLYAANACGEVSTQCLLACSDIDEGEIGDCYCWDGFRLRRRDLTIVVTLDGPASAVPITISGSPYTLPLVDLSGSYAFHETYTEPDCVGIWSPDEHVLHHEFFMTDSFGRDLYHRITLKVSLSYGIGNGLVYWDGAAWTLLDFRFDSGSKFGPLWVGLNSGYTSNTCGSTRICHAYSPYRQGGWGLDYFTSLLVQGASYATY